MSSATATADATADAANTNYKLVAYNTSWVNDCHNNQLHPGLSESASIVAKAVKLGYNQELIDKEASEKTYLKSLRDSFSQAETAYILSKLNSKIEFFALIEQSIHVPADNHANYDIFHATPAIKTNKQDLNAPHFNINTQYGILHRLEILNRANNTNNAKDETFVKDISVDPIDTTIDYSCVYDCVMNPTIPSGPAGEGIGIIFKTGLVDTLLEWNKTDHPVYKALKLKFPDVKDTRNLGTVHYYSEDMGNAVCYSDYPLNIQLKYYNASGTAADLGRPFIMTGGIKGADTLNLFIAFHGSNIFNLSAVKYGYIQLSENSTDETTNAKNKKLNKESKDKYAATQIKNLLNNVEQSEEIKSTVDELFKQVAKSIQSIINEGLKANKSQILDNITKVNVFMGADANDPRGQLLETLTSQDFKLKITIKDKPYDVKFNYNLGPRTVAPDNQNTTTQAGYPSLITGCANTDSLNGGIRKVELPATGPINYNRITNYPENFEDPANFGYNGDYALFGSNNDSTIYEMKVDYDKTNSIYHYTKDSAKGIPVKGIPVKVIPSDHLAVMSNAVQSVISNLNGNGNGGRKTRKIRSARRSNRRSNRRGKQSRRVSRTARRGKQSRRK